MSALFSVVYLSRGTLPQKEVRKGTSLGDLGVSHRGTRQKVPRWSFLTRSLWARKRKRRSAGLVRSQAGPVREPMPCLPAKNTSSHCKQRVPRTKPIPGILPKRVFHRKLRFEVERQFSMLQASIPKILCPGCVTTCRKSGISRFPKPQKDHG